MAGSASRFNVSFSPGFWGSSLGLFLLYIEEKASDCHLFSKFKKRLICTSNVFVFNSSAFTLFVSLFISSSLFSLRSNNPFIGIIHFHLFQKEFCAKICERSCYR